MKSTRANSARTIGPLALAILAAIASPCAFADDDFGWYVGGNYGQSNATIDDPRITNTLLTNGFTSVSIVDDDSDTGYKFFGGYQFNRYFAVEGGYFNLGEFGYVATTVPAGTLTGRIKLQGVNLDLVGMLPLGEKFSAFARVGANFAEARDTFTSTGAVIVTNPNPSQRGTNIKYGVGLQYAFNDAFAIRAEAERYRIDDAVGNKGDVDLYSVGLVYRFGRDTDEVEPVAAPMPVADCSSMDDDGDGVNNCNDKCPGSAAGQAIGPDGCPVPVPEPEPVMAPKPFKN